MKELYDYLVQQKITPNGLFILHTTHQNYMYASYVNYKSEQYRLALTGHLVEDKFGGLNPVYKITDKGLHVIREAEQILAKMKRAKKTEIPFSDWEEHIVKYNDMFPKGKKQGSSVTFKTNPKELFDRFKWFFKEYPEYTWEDVFAATEMYIKVYEDASDFTYMQTSKYFVKKEDKSKSTTSSLASLIYNIKSGNVDDVDSGFHYFGP
jgi:hypothetical protein